MGRQTGSKVADFSYTRTDNSHSTKIRSITTPTTVTKSLPWPFPGFWVDYCDLPLFLVSVSISVSISIFFPVSISIIVVVIVIAIVCINLVANDAADYGSTDRSNRAAVRQDGARNATDTGAGQGILILS
jgi:hypothetical protein